MGALDVLLDKSLRASKRSPALDRFDQHQTSISSAYVNDGILDPMAAKIQGIDELPDAPGHRFFGMVTGQVTEAHYVMDTETYGRRPDLLHIGCLMKADDTSNFDTFTEWQEFLDMLMGKITQHKKTRVWAHHGSGFDYVGFAAWLGLNYGDENYFIEISEESDGLVKPKKVGRPAKEKTIKVNVKIEVFGSRQLIVMTIGKYKHRLELVDSRMHLESALRTLGSKGVTPHQYINPARWLKKMHREPEDFDFWKSTVSKRALAYCINDCKVLADALMTYRQFGLDNFGDDPLNHMTAPKAGLAMSILLAPPPNNLSDIVMVHQNIGGSRTSAGYPDWELKARKEIKPGSDGKNTVLATELANDKPFAPRNSYSYATAGWYCKGEYAREFSLVQYGGMTQIFAAITKDNYRPVSIDAHSQYASVMGTASLLRFLDPRNLQRLSDDIRGKQLILEHLTKRSGMYLIETMPATNPEIQKFPIFPMRVAGHSKDARLAWVDWKDKLRLYVTGEELRYFLESTDVENDDIIVLRKHSITGPLLPYSDSPLKNFASRLYKLRKDAHKANNGLYKQICKLLLSAGGFGPHSEMREQSEDMKAPMRGEKDHALVEGYGRRAQRTLQYLEKLDPLWTTWKETRHSDLLKDDAIFNEEYCNRAIYTAKVWGSEHWRRFTSFTAANGEVIMPVIVKQYLASHSIKPWAVQITAAARVALHKSILAVNKTRVEGQNFQVCYCDTDSVHFGVPAAMTDAEIVDALKNSGVNMDNNLNTPGDMGNLGEWGLENLKVDRSLVPYGYNPLPAKALFLAPKCYVYVDSDNNVLKTTVKGVPSSHPIMRAAMASISIRNTRLGSKSGISLDDLTTRDALVNLPSPKRSHYSEYDSGSIKLFQPKNIEKGATWRDYCQMFGGMNGNTKGINKAVEYFTKHCKAFNIPIWRLRASLKPLQNDILLKIAEAKDRGEKIDGNDLQQIINELMNRLKRFNPTDFIEEDEDEDYDNY